jgi:hypothetical protein
MFNTGGTDCVLVWTTSFRTGRDPFKLGLGSRRVEVSSDALHKHRHGRRARLSRPPLVAIGPEFQL